mgnify:CR=1 FL=1
MSEGERLSVYVDVLLCNFYVIGRHITWFVCGCLEWQLDGKHKRKIIMCNTHLARSAVSGEVPGRTTCRVE